MSLQSYLHEYTSRAAHHSGGVSSSTTIKVPFLEIYDKSRNLIYHEDAWEKNAQLFSGLPQTLQGLTVSPNHHPAFKEMIELVPDFRVREQAILSEDRYTALAVTVHDCKLCAKEDELVARLRDRSARLDFCVLELILQP